MTQHDFRTFRVGSITTASLCTMCVSAVGLLLLIAGAVVTGIVYTEVRPPSADENYDRYRGADLRRVLGPLMLALGAFLLIGGCVFIACAWYSSQKDTENSYAEGSREYDPSGRPQDVKVSKY